MIHQAMSNSMYYTYILRCMDGSLYTGITTDIARRFLEHKAGGSVGAKYTRSRKPAAIEAVWQSENRVLASKLEYRVKHLTREKKLKLISENDIEHICTGLEAENYTRVSLSETEHPSL